MLAHSVAERNPSFSVANVISVDVLFHSCDYNVLPDDLFEELDVRFVTE